MKGKYIIFKRFESIVHLHYGPKLLLDSNLVDIFDVALMRSTACCLIHRENRFLYFPFGPINYNYSLIKYERVHVTIFVFQF